MSNTNSPNGFQYYGRLEGGSPTEGLTRQFISSGDTNALGYGDPVVRLSSGYVQAQTTSASGINGIFYGCTYVSSVLGRTVWQNYWAGAGGATGDVTVYICDDPDAQFVVQSDNTAISFGNIGMNVATVLGTPNSTTQFSTAAIGQSTVSTTNTLPFRIVGQLSQTAPPGMNGTDNTSAFNRVIVAPNNWDRKNLTGI